MSRHLYIETSALLRVLLEGDAALERELAVYGQHVISALTVLEATRSVGRAKRDRRIDSVQKRLVLAKIRELEHASHVVAIDDDLLRRAAGELPVEPVRTLDALHLAAISTWDEETGDIDVASVDDRVRDNAGALGFRLVPAVVTGRRD